MSDDYVFNAVCMSTVTPGLCLITKENEDEIKIIYVGPIRQAPDVEHCKVYLNPIDFERLSSMINKRKH